MSTTTVPCVDEFEESYQRLRVAIIVVTCITGIVALFSLIVCFKKRSRRKVSPEYLDTNYTNPIVKYIQKLMCCHNDSYQYENSTAFKGFIDKLNQFISNVSLDEYSIIEYINTEEAIQCSLCLEEISKNEKISELRCSHTFHKKCIIEWFRNGNNTCLVCNETIIV
jgi:hypothetical protein